MEALKFLLIVGSLLIFILTALYIAEKHYRTYKGDLPLHYIYSLIATFIWGTLAIYFLIDLPNSQL